MSQMTEAEALDERVADMVAWLNLMLRPVADWDEVDSAPYRPWDDSVVELGERVADEWLTEWAWGHRDATGLAVVLQQRITRGTQRAGQGPPVHEVDPAVDLAEEPLVAEPGAVVWSVPPYAPYVLPASVLRAITAWMDAHQVQDASGAHEVRVEAHPDGTHTIAYHRGCPPRRTAPADPSVTPARVLLRTEPPTLPELPDLTGLGAVLKEHPAGRGHVNLPLPIGSVVCCTCSTRENPVGYPCPPVVDAAAAAGVEVFPDDDEPDRDDEELADDLVDVDPPAWATAGLGEAR